jgi:amino acid adenylation domain-containing protein
VRPLIQLMAELRQAKIRVWAEEDQLRYQAPTGVLTPSLLAELRNRKAEILDFCRQVQASAETPVLQAAPRGVVHEISLAQHRLWILDQIERPSATYNISLALLLQGDLDAGALQRSSEALIRRHEALRTHFQISGDAVRPVIASACALPWSVVDLQHLPAEQRLPDVRRQARDQALCPFDLSRPPLIRLVLWKTAPAEHVLMMIVHHIISDRRSVEILAEELGLLYEAYCDGSEPRLPDLAFQYSDFAWHQRRSLSHALLQRQLDYWCRQLAGLPPLLELPSDRPRPAVFSSAGSTICQPLGADLVGPLRHLARQSGATLYMAMVAALATVLSRYSGRENILIACPATHRNQAGLDRLVGFFINTLALRIDLSGSPTFRDLLLQLRGVVTDAFLNQDVPFEKVLETLRVERDRSYPPLLQVSAVMMDGEPSLPSLRGLRTTPFDFGNPTTRYDISLEIYETEAGIDIFWIYSTGLFEPESVARMTRHLNNLIKHATSDPDRSVFELELMDATERDRLLVAFNDTQRPYPRQATIDELFERQAEATPDAVAAEFGEAQLSYRALNCRANQVARKLRGLGAGPRTMVAVCLQRSLELPVALLGVLKAGAAFVPIDPADPLARIDHVLNDVQPVVIVSTAHLAEHLPASKTYVLCLDANGDEIAREDIQNPPRSTTADHPAYVMYTSGSTGRPKGVCVIHRGVVRLVKSADYVSLSPQETLLQLAPITFDASTFEIWGALLNGGRLVIMPPQTPTLAELGAALRQHHVTTLWLSAGLFHLMVDERPDDLRSLRQLLAGGDVLSPEHVRRLLQGGDGRLTLVNGYGPTEATTFACCEAMTALDQTTMTVPIGRPIANTRVYVLDRHLHPVPLGVDGELYIAGDGLARGYLNDEAMTEERFIADPFDPRPNRRMYRTGDLVRWRSDGRLAFLGRRDRQVKVRGFRIELEAIEAAICDHPAIRQAVVLTVADDVDKRLVAYVTPASGVPTLSELRAFVRRRLPDYMLPDTVVAREALALTPNGKVDRAALQRIGAEQEQQAQYEPPINDTETRLAEIWGKVLVRDRVGRHDGFFDLGGYSLLATRIIARVQDVFGVTLPLRVLFEEGSVAAMAKAVDENTQAARDAAAKLRAQIEQMDAAEIREMLQHKRRRSPTSRNLTGIAGVMQTGVMESKDG